MRTFILSLWILPIFALDNGVTVMEASGSSQTARPTSISRFFAKGEFPAGTYPKPRIDGAVPSVWQVDLKTAWPDGSVQHAIISTRLSLSSGGSVMVDFVSDSNPCYLGDLPTCEATALNEAGMLALSWGARLTGTLNSISYYGDARTILDNGNFTYWLRGPVVTQVLVEDLTTALASNFGWQYDGSAWIEPTGDQYKSLRPAFDLAFWPDPDGGGPLAAWPGVWVQTRLYNDSTTRIQRIPLEHLDFEVGSELSSVWSMCSSGCTVTGSPTMQSGRSFRREAWDGAAPGNIVIDHNLPYVIHSRLMPQFSLNVPIPAAIGYMEAFYDTDSAPDIQWCASSGRCANIVKAMGATGGRPDLGIFPGWTVAYLTTMGHPEIPVATKLAAWNKLIIRTADAVTSMPIHSMETDASTYRDSPADGQRYYFHAPHNTTDRAFGRVISVNARPNLFFNNWATGLPDNGVLVCTSGPCNPNSDYNGWAVDAAHFPNLLFIPYLLSGNPFYQRELQYVATNRMATFNHGRALWARNGTWVTSWSDGFTRRIRAWALRDYFLAAVASQEPERSYFAEKVRNNWEQQEGFYGITDGVFYPGSCADPFNVNTEPNIWCFGKNGNATQGISVTKYTGANPLGFQTYGYPDEVGGFPNSVTRGDRPFMMFYEAATLGWINEMSALEHAGQSYFSTIMPRLANHYIGQVLHPDTHPYNVSMYTRPTERNDDIGMRFINSWAEYNASYVRDGQLTSAIDSSTTSFQVTFDNNSAALPRPEELPSYIKVGDEWIRYCGWSSSGSTRTATVCTGGRGMFGTGAQSHESGTPTYNYTLFAPTQDFQHGYSVMAKAVLSFFYGHKSSDGLTGRRAFEWMEGAMQGRQNANTNFHWFFMPRDSIDHFRVKVSGNTATFRWHNRSVQSCKFYIGATEPGSSLDSEDYGVSSGLKEQKYVASDLEAGTYHYRVTCGTARVRGSISVSP